jgi:predicted chitinase
MSNRQQFFTFVREEMTSGGILRQSQVDGFIFLLSQMEVSQIEKHQQAYMLATVWHETGREMQPVRESPRQTDEWRKRNLRYFPYYGRGYVQITWRDNYTKFGDRLGIDLVGDPDLALQPEISWQILHDGMVHGLFTGMGLGRYINNEKIDYTNARRIINGNDKASVIAGYANQFWKAL